MLNVVQRTNLVEKLKGFSSNFNPFLKKTKATLSGVLLIDGNKICQKVNTTYLEKLGCLVELVDTAREALEKLVLPYKIIFLDENLPDCSSNVLINLIRNDQQNINKDTPIIVTTSSWPSKSFIKKYLDLGANEIFIKPIIVTDFKRVLNKYMCFAKFKEVAYLSDRPLAQKKIKHQYIIPNP